MPTCTDMDMWLTTHHHLQHTCRVLPPRYVTTRYEIRDFPYSLRINHAKNQRGRLTRLFSEKSDAGGTTTYTSAEYSPAGRASTDTLSIHTLGHLSTPAPSRIHGLSHVMFYAV